MAKTTARSDQYPLRLPDGMRDRIAEAARANGRSMNAEIIDRLERSFAGHAGERDADWLLHVQPDGTNPVADLRREVAALRQEIDQWKKSKS